MAVTSDTAIRRLVLDFTPKNVAPVDMPTNFDVEVHVRGLEVSLAYAGAPRIRSSRNIPPESGLSRLRKAELLELIEGLR